MRSAFFSAIAATSVVALSMSMPASAAPMVNNYSLGNLSVLGQISRTHAFNPGPSNTFADYYTFAITAPSNVTGTTLESDGAYKAGFYFKTSDLDVSSVTLSKKQADGTFLDLVSDASPEVFFFSSLASGYYRLKIQGGITTTYTSTAPTTGRVASYTITAAAAPIASASPEPAGMAMMGLGLAVVAVWSRRSRMLGMPG